MSDAASQFDAPITPWPLPADATRVLVVGGTFDPPHRGHVELVDFWRACCQPDAALLFVPAAQSPLKQGQTQTPTKHRVAMLRLAAAHVEWNAVWTDEVDRYQAAPGTPSYTVDTLRRIHKVAPGVELQLMLGSDQAAQFHKWREARQILKLARPVVVPREPFETWPSLGAAMRSTNFWTENEIDSWGMYTQSHFAERNPASSTEIRRCIATGGVASVPHGWLYSNVSEYIQAHRLYSSG